jgi:hypothetical protein
MQRIYKIRLGERGIRDVKYQPGVFAPLLPFPGDSFYMGESGLSALADGTRTTTIPRIEKRFPAGKDPVQ